MKVERYRRQRWHRDRDDEHAAIACVLTFLIALAIGLAAVGAWDAQLAPETPMDVHSPLGTGDVERR